MVRLDGPDGPLTEPPSWLTTERLSVTTRNVLSRAEVPTREGQSIRWGLVYDLKDLSLDSNDAKRVAGYIAKYAVKTTDGTTDLARRFHSRREIENLVSDPHAPPPPKQPAKAA